MSGRALRGRGGGEGGGGGEDYEEEGGIDADCEIIGSSGWHCTRNRRCGLGWLYLRL